MSILIKGMEMPKSCEDCPLGDSLHCQVLPSVPALWAEYTNAIREKRLHSDCPLIPIPPHGRLIDVDKLGIRDAEKRAYEAYLREKGEDFIEEPIIEYHRGYLEGLTHASGLVRFAPTIIHESKEEQ